MNSRTILLVDDDQDEHLIFATLVKELDTEIKCITASNGLEAFVHLRTLVPPPTHIFLDLNMPLMNGFECLKQIKNDARFQHIPVIIFTTSDNPMDKQLSIEAGADYFLTKMPDINLLKKVLADILKMDFTLQDENMRK